MLRYASLLRWTEIRTRWQEIQQLRRELFSEGGVVITVPPDAADGAPLAARTVVQPDGDVVCFVSEAALHAGSSALGVQMRAVHEKRGPGLSLAVLPRRHFEVADQVTGARRRILGPGHAGLEPGHAHSR